MTAPGDSPAPSSRDRLSWLQRCFRRTGPAGASRPSWHFRSGRSIASFWTGSIPGLSRTGRDRSRGCRLPREQEYGDSPHPEDGGRREPVGWESGGVEPVVNHNPVIASAHGPSKSRQAFRKLFSVGPRSADSARCERAARAAYSVQCQLVGLTADVIAGIAFLLDTSLASIKMSISELVFAEMGDGSESDLVGRLQGRQLPARRRLFRDAGGDARRLQGALRWRGIGRTPFRR